MNIKINRRTVEAIVSAVSAIICACFCGCRLALSNLQVEDFDFEVLGTNALFHVEH